MDNILERFKKLAGGEEAFQKAQAEVAALQANTDQSARHKNLAHKRPLPTPYTDPAEHDRVVGQEVLNSILASDPLVGRPAPQDMVFSSLWTTQKLCLDLLQALNPQERPDPEILGSNFGVKKWNIYYLTSRFADSPILLVPEAETRFFVQHILVQYGPEAQERGYSLPDPKSMTLAINLFDFPQPRLLGNVHVDALVFNILTRAMMAGEGPYEGDATIEEADYIKELLRFPNLYADLKLSLYRQTVERLAEIKDTNPQSRFRPSNNLNTNITENKGTAVQSLSTAIDASSRKPSVRRGGQNLDKERLCNALRRLQRYLGLRPSKGPHNSSENAGTPILNTNERPKYPFDLDLIFLCIDVEADECNQAIISEVGVAMLDTRKLHNLAPGKNGKDWLNQVTARHFRITEHSHVRNHRYVTGNPDGFISTFGTSEYVPLSQAAAKIRDCFQVPEHQQQSNSIGHLTLRNVVLVGHQVKGDIKYLSNIGFDLLEVGNVVEVFSTDDLQRALKHESAGGTSLARLLQDMDIDAWNLHNAGNDAAYTLQAMIAIALKSLSDMRPLVNLEQKIHEAESKAKANVEAECNAWNSAELKSGDGHAPIPYERSTLRG